VTTQDSENRLGAYVAGNAGSKPIDVDQPARTLGFHETGFHSAESCLSVTRDGTLFFAPAFTPNGASVLRSRNAGRSWQDCTAGQGALRKHGRPQPFLFLEPQTERLFFFTAAFGTLPPKRGFHLSWSDDHGETWQHSHFAHDTSDWGKLYGGRSRGRPGARVLYFSAPSPISTRVFPVIFPRRQSVYRSYDNGANWEAAQSISLRPGDHGLPRREWVIFGNGCVGPDGTVFLGFRQGPNFAVAVSHDDANSWHVHPVPGAELLPFRNLLQVGLINPNYVIGEPLTVDAAGNLYALWPDPSDRLRMSRSANHGKTWSEPLVVSAPKVRKAYYGAINAGPDHRVAIAYYGTEDGRRYHGYISETAGPTAAAPRFVGGTVNDPALPLYPRGWDTGYIDMFAGGDLNEIVQVRYSPAGSVFTSFCRQERPGWPRSARPRARLSGIVGELR
jgi:hypothetical protein